MPQNPASAGRRKGAPAQSRCPVLTRACAISLRPHCVAVRPIGQIHLAGERAGYCVEKILKLPPPSGEPVQHNNVPCDEGGDQTRRHEKIPLPQAVEVSTWLPCCWS